MPGTRNSGGHNTKPIELKLLDGTMRGKATPNVPLARPGVGDGPPSWLGPIAQQVWKTTVAAMAAVPGWLRETDTNTLAGYCDAYAELQMARAICQREGMTYEYELEKTEQAADGSPRDVLARVVKTRPEVRIAQQARTAMRGFASDLGLSPVARARISLPDVSEQDDLLDKARS